MPADSTEPEAIMPSPTEQKVLDSDISPAPRGGGHSSTDRPSAELRAGNSLQASHLEMFRTFFDEAQQGAALVDGAGIIRYANHAACAFIHRKLSTIVGTRLSEAAWLWDSDEQRDAVQRAAASAAAGVRIQLRTTHRAEDGTLHPMSLTLRPLRQSDGQVSGAIVEAWDIAQRIQIEADLEQTHLTLEAIIEQSPVATIVATAPDGFVRIFNRVATDLMGSDHGVVLYRQPMRELIGHQGWQVFRADGSPIPVADRAMTRALRGESTSLEEHRLLRKDGTSRWMLVSAAPIYDHNGQLTAGVMVLRDITEERTKAEQLRQLANEQRTILHTIGAGIVLLKNRKLQWVNPAYVATFGYSEDELRFVDTAVFYANRDDYDRVGQEGYAELARGGFYTTEALMRRKDGTEFWCQISGNAIDPERIDEGTIWVLQDISEHKRREDALRNSERKLAEIFRASPEMIIVGHAESARFITVNEAFTRLTGFEPHEVLQRTSLEIGLWPSAEARAQVLRQANERGELRNYEGQLRKKSGELIDVLMSAASFTMEGEKCLIWIITDITKYNRVQRAVREGELRFKRLVENSNDLIAVTDEQVIIGSVVGPLEKTLGYKSEDVLGRSTSEFVHPSDVASFNKALLELLAEPNTSQRLECRLQHKRGDYIDVEAVGNNWLEDPVIRGIVWNVRDISERKQSDAERSKLQEQLQQAMKMEAVGRLAGGVAHDFNNLLTVISGNLDLLRDEFDSADPVMQPLSDISKAADSAAGLTRQLLAFSRQQIIEPRRVDLNELISNLQKMLGRLIGEDIELRVKLAEGLASVRVDPGQFDQVVINLVVNARDAMSHGGTLTIETVNTALDEEYCQMHSGVNAGNYVMLAITDSGHGMTAEVRRHIFEPFYTTKPKGQGTGLGLAMIFGAVKQAGGAIEVYSEIGQGTTFKLYLPCINEPAERLSRRAQAQSLPRGEETVLLVEDEPSVRGLTENILKRLGYVILSAANGHEALKLAKEYTTTIDLLMTDVVMPGMNGRELAEQIWQTHPTTRVLFTSGYTEDVIIHHGVLRENLSFISKPYSLQGLALKLRQVLDSGH